MEAFVGNFFMLLWIGAGSLACGLLHPVLGWVFLGLSFFTIYVVLKKLVCTNCYYYGKRCSMGWGKLAALMFKPGRIERFPTSVGIKIAPAVYGSLTAIPLVILVVLMLKRFHPVQLGLFAFLLVLGVYSWLSRPRACARCKMRYICPGSAAK